MTKQNKKMIGINACHGDSSACLVVGGKLIAAVEEERYTRIKHRAGFQSESMLYWLPGVGLFQRFLAEMLFLFNLVRMFFE